MTVAGGAFIPAKKRWVIERSFAWLYDCYRLSVDRERLTRNSNTMVRLAFIRLILRRLWPS
jgi:putative transposase